MKEQLHHFAETADTPFFIYDLDALRTHLNSLAAGDVRLWYACKANPLGAVLDAVNEAGLGFDTASLGELEHVLSRGITGDRILLTGPGKTRAFLEHALQAGVSTFVVESAGQLRLLDQLAVELGRHPQVLLRLQLDWSGSGSNLLGGDGIAAFGMAPGDWSLFQFNELRAARPVGFHVFQWGNVLELNRLASIWERIAEEVAQLADQLSFPFEILDLGGGLGIPYEENDRALEWAPLMATLADLRAAGGWRETWLELGRYAVGPFGRYLARVADRKRVRGEELLVLEGGINHLLRPALTGQAFPCSALTGTGEDLTVFQVHGPLCTALDRLGNFQLPEHLAPGDWLVFDQCGAYGFTESMPYFLCHDLPGEAVWDGDRVRWERTPEPASAYLR
ncbi:MAG: PLP-dependent decarboxylase [Acidobacteriota bacterium]|nr:PLP-dependent decarboxylase [Acidobacteriota bacterium]